MKRPFLKEVCHVLSALATRPDGDGPAPAAAQFNGFVTQSYLDIQTLLRAVRNSPEDPGGKCLGIDKKIDPDFYWGSKQRRIIRHGGRRCRPQKRGYGFIKRGARIGTPFQSAAGRILSGPSAASCRTSLFSITLQKASYV
jgi:hypothetical protein